MPIQGENADHSDGSDALEAGMSVVAGMPIEARRQTYQECARRLLRRYLVEEGLVDGSLEVDECKPSVEECIAENADGIYYLFYVRGSVWGVMLSRHEDQKRIIEQSPERLNDPELFVMDLRQAAKIKLKNDAFCQ